MNDAELPLQLEEQRKNNFTVLFVSVVCLLISAFVFFQFIGLDERMKDVERMQYERLEIARRLEARDSIARQQYDSIVAIEARVRAGQILELKQKGLWREQ